MARTLSPANQITIALAAIVTLALLADRAWSERPRQSAAPTNDARSSVKLRPEAPPTSAPTTANGLHYTRPATASFRNPFASESDSPQAEGTVLPGPRSRWRIPRPISNAPQPEHPPTPADTPSPASTASPTNAPSVLQLMPPLSTPSSAPAITPVEEPSPPDMVIITDQPEPLPPATPPSEEGPVKTAILSAGANRAPDATRALPKEHTPLLSDDSDTSTLRIVTRGALELPDPARYTTGPSNKPAWLESPAKLQSPSAPSVQAGSLDTQRSVLRNGPNRPASVIEQTALEQPQRELPATNSTISIAPAADAASDGEPELIADYDDSPTAWLAEAQAKSRTAQSLDELLTVAQLCERMINADPRDKRITFAQKLAAWAHNRRGELLVDADQPADALAAFQAAIDHDPTSALAIHNRAVTFAQQNNFDAALADFNRVIELNPGLGVAYRNRAELLAAQGKAEDAIADYSRTIESMPDDAELYRARAHALQQLDQFERALGDVDRSIRIAPDAAQGYAQRGNLLADRGDFAHAIDDFKQALAIDAKLTEAHRSVAWIKATCPDERQRDAFEALSAAHSAVKLSSPDDYMAVDVLAAAHANAGEFDKAIAAQQRAINAAPDDAVPPMRARLTLYEHRRPYRVGR